jgi:hypothetical protein
MNIDRNLERCTNNAELQISKPGEKEKAHGKN